VIWVCAALAGEVVEPLANGEVDWTTGTLRVHASGNPHTGAWSDVRVAEQAALAQLELRVTEYAGQLDYDSDRVAGELGEELDGAWQITQTTYHTSGQVELVAELELHGWLRGALVEVAAADADRREPTLSGVLVDARTVDAEACLAPRLLDPSGALVYGAASMSRDSATQRAPVVWVADPADPAAGDRVGENPLILVAADARGCDIVLDELASSRVRQLGGTSVLADAHVVVVM